MKNQTALYVSIGVLVLVLLGGFMIVKSFNKPVPEEIEEEEQFSNLPPADPSIIVDVKAKPDGKAVIITISHIPGDVESIEYELSYNTGAGLSKGALGKIDVNGKSEVTKEVLLGTCSKNTCTYDTGVIAVNVVLKFNTPDGASQLTKDFSLE